MQTGGNDRRKKEPECNELPGVLRSPASMTCSQSYWLSSCELRRRRSVVAAVVVAQLQRRRQPFHHAVLSLSQRPEPTTRDCQLGSASSLYTSLRKMPHRFHRGRVRSEHHGYNEALEE